MEPSILDSLGGRKFLLSLIVLALGTVVQLVTPGGVNTAFVSLLVGALGVFNGANALITTKMSPSQDEAPAAPADVPQPTVDVDGINNRIRSLETGLTETQQALMQVGQGVANFDQKLDLVNKRLLAR